MVAVTTPIAKREHHLDKETMETPPLRYPRRAWDSAMIVYSATSTPSPQEATMPSPANDPLLSCKVAGCVWQNRT